MKNRYVRLVKGLRQLFYIKGFGVCKLFPYTRYGVSIYIDKGCIRETPLCLDVPRHGYTYAVCFCWFYACKMKDHHSGVISYAHQYK